MYYIQSKVQYINIQVMGCGRPGPGGPGTHKDFRINFTMGGHPQRVLAGKLSGNGNFR